jgi:Flp pilus assembly protein TadD
MPDQPVPAARSLWISRPSIDLVVGCGGWSLPLLLASYQLVEADARRWSAVFYTLALACNYPHYMATIHRAYFRREDRERYRLFTHHFTAGLVLLGLAAHVQPVLVAWLFTLYVMWSPWHYTGQNFGLLMMFLRRAGVEVSPSERRRLRIAFVASYVLLLAAFNQAGPVDPLVRSLNLPVAISWPLQAAAALVFVVAGAPTMAVLAWRAGWRAALAPLTLCLTQALWFVVPIALTWVGGASVPQTRYSSGILAIMHSAQYLWITQHFTKRAAAGGSEGASWSQARYWATLVVGGIALFVPFPWLASYVGRLDFTTSMLIVTSIVNIHHFILDGVVWKLRDSRVSSVLVQPNGAASTPQAADRPATSALPHPVPDRVPDRVSTPGTGPDPDRRGARPALVLRVVRVAGACALVALALVDQWRYRLASEPNPAALAVARQLNPYDTPVYVKLAAAGLRGGDAGAAEHELRRAIEAHPDVATPYRALGRLLVESNRFADAYAITRAALERWPEDVPTLVNAGVLASRLGHVAEAEQWWRRALEADPTQTDVHLYLAELLDAASRSQEALPHYQRHLELVAQRPDAARSAPQRVALVIVKFGDALARTGQRDLAATQYDLAERIAQRTGLRDVAALVRDRRAQPRDQRVD